MEKKKPESEPTHIKVVATTLGYYDHKRRRPGDVFTVSTARNAKGQYVEFAPSWMERVPDDTPERITTGRDALRQQHQDILQSKHAQGQPATPPPQARNPLVDD